MNVNLSAVSINRVRQVKVLFRFKLLSHYSSYIC